MVETCSVDAVAAAIGAGTQSSTTEKHPASCNANVISTTYAKTLSYKRKVKN